MTEDGTEIRTCEVCGALFRWHGAFDESRRHNSLETCVASLGELVGELMRREEHIDAGVIEPDGTDECVRAEERAACAQIADAEAERWNGEREEDRLAPAMDAAERIAAAIRARGDEREKESTA